MNAAEGEVGEVNFDGTQQGGTSDPDVHQRLQALRLEALLWAAMGDGIHTNADGGEFTMLLDGNVQIAQFDVGSIHQPTPDLQRHALGQYANLSPAPKPLRLTFRVRSSRPHATRPYQYVTDVDVEGTVPEPSSILLLGIGALSLAGVLRRKLRF